MDRSLDRSLQSLACSGRCAPEEAASYRRNLEELARSVIDESQIHVRSRIFKALGDKTRLRIVSLLKIRELCVCEIMAALHLTQPTASHHLNILENAGIVKERKEGRWVFYSISDMKLLEWI
ncbi:MAG: metalloregulator ArsR/SmtB family transcription factor [Candidatus Bathyarchaeia archaeon]